MVASHPLIRQKAPTLTLTALWFSTFCGHRLYPSGSESELHSLCRRIRRAARESSPHLALLAPSPTPDSLFPSLWSPDLLSPRRLEVHVFKILVRNVRAILKDRWLDSEWGDTPPPFLFWARIHPPAGVERMRATLERSDLSIADKRLATSESIPLPLPERAKRASRAMV